MTAVFVVPFYQYINLCTLCPKDYAWAAAFKYIEGIRTARQIQLRTPQQMSKLAGKMKHNYYQAVVLSLSVLVSYCKCVCVCVSSPPPL